MQRQHFVLLLVFPFLLASLSLPALFAYSVGPDHTISLNQPPQDQAQQAINEAQTAINTAYTTLAFADAAGSPIIDLISTLNGAIGQLSQARHAYNQTNYPTAITIAEAVTITANTVNEEAHLRGITTVAQTQAQILFVFAVVVISIPTTYFAITYWQQYRKAKRREFLQMGIRLPDEEDEKP